MLPLGTPSALCSTFHHNPLEKGPSAFDPIESESLVAIVKL
jgi:hypothetical protein